jgi:hypothetical protein
MSVQGIPTLRAYMCACRISSEARSHKNSRCSMVVPTRADQYRQLARDCRLMAQSLAAGENRSALLEMEEWERLADQQEHATM